MDFNRVEDLVLRCKEGDEEAKGMLCLEFRPFIINLSNKFKIYSYDFNDLMGECYRALFVCISKYDINRKRFVGFATNSIKYAIYNLLRDSKRRAIFESSEILTVSDNLEHVLVDDFNLEDFVVDKGFSSFVLECFSSLSLEDRMLLDFVFFKGGTMRDYSKLKGLSYYEVFSRKNSAVKRLASLVRV